MNQSELNIQNSSQGVINILHPPLSLPLSDGETLNLLPTQQVD